MNGRIGGVRDHDHGLIGIDPEVPFGERQGAARDIVLLNAAAAIYAGDAAASLEEGFAKAQQALDSGAAKAKQQEFIDYNSRCAV